ncbi:hypothetical protein, partial [Enterococcus faecium]|uniref:hypothetical protein n=1 Tax=Enterococcus faecium TaxID=1352 RepID=UPI0002829AA3
VSLLNICYTKSVTGNTVTLKGKRIKGVILMPPVDVDEGYQPSESHRAFLFFVFSIVQIYHPKVQNENQFITSIADN